LGGIAGVARFDTGGDASVERLVERQLAVSEHRGGQAFRDFDGRAALAARRHEVDLAGGAGDGDLIVVADARLDDRTALLDALGMDDPARSADDGGDARLILEAYRRWGEACAAHLSGDFAFAVWDRRQGTLYAARDRVGVKQLHYHRAGHTLVFATEIRAVLTALAERPALNRAVVAYHLLDVMEDEEATLFEGVRRLAPGHFMLVDEGGVATRRYWALDPSRETRLANDGEYADAYRALFHQAVADRLRGPGRTGAMVSGGLDSSSIAAMAGQVGGPGGRDLAVFHAVFPQLGESADSAYVQQLLAGGSFEAHEVPITDIGPLSAGSASGDDEPLRTPGLRLHLGLYAAARAAGCAAILDGDGGDDVVSHGNGRLAELVRSGRFAALVRESRLLRMRTGVPVRRTLATWGLRPLLPETLLRRRRVMLGRDPWGCAVPTPLNPEFARAIDLPARLRNLCAATSGTPHSAREEHMWMLTSGLTAHSLGVLDRVAAAEAIEPRFPFLDHRLMEFCLSLPGDQKLADGWTRVVARRGMAGVLPDDIRWRGDKATMTGGLVGGLLHADREVLRDIIDGDGAIWDFADRDRVRALSARFLALPTPGDALMLWLVASTARWLQQVPAVPRVAA
jgi:asparagine synthase (glutamine-hydrolysing)